MLPVIFDPLTYLNASKGSYRIDEIKSIFREAHDKLNYLKIQFERDETQAQGNIAYFLLTNFDKINISD